MKKDVNCILLIDDDEATNFIHKLVLTRAGYTKKVVIADSATKALNYLKSASHTGDYPKPDLIFLDINMPAMDGWDFMNSYNALTKDQKGDVVIVMLTTSLNPNDEERANAIEYVRKYLKKPLTNEKFQMVLDEFF